MNITKQNILNYLRLFYDIVEDGWAKDKLSKFFKYCEKNPGYAEQLVNEVYKDIPSMEKADIVHFIMFPEEYISY